RRAAFRGGRCGTRAPPGPRGGRPRGGRTHRRSRRRARPRAQKAPPLRAGQAQQAAPARPQARPRCPAPREAKIRSASRGEERPSEPAGAPQEGPTMTTEVPTHTRRPPRVGQTYAGFRLVRALGEGTFANVFEAASPSYDHPVALKISKDPVDSEATALRALREIRILGALGNPHVVHIYDHGLG